MAPLSTQSAMSKLIHTSKLIQRCKGVTPGEAKRINHLHAVSLLRERYPPEDTTGAERQSAYLDFLREVQSQGGRSMVVLCAVGLGLLYWTKHYNGIHSWSWQSGDGHA
ncbi:hypothetical protein BP00DRAFT_423433 [Aspergillus indologenus CBS 114.80]|uniref:Uncharacterized protein n=1 Tax=Aspergillus indologenus CBS 114.80 TaxID=1450541 RepID=A0A2V5IDJ1_9EURO|nr:hypothetical protein BP00DRAFT_423433 [Aspergillus indologenus CBS 114.80]